MRVKLQMLYWASFGSTNIHWEDSKCPWFFCAKVKNTHKRRFAALGRWWQKRTWAWREESERTQLFNQWDWPKYHFQNARPDNSAGWNQVWSTWRNKSKRTGHKCLENSEVHWVKHEITRSKAKVARLSHDVRQRD